MNIVILKGNVVRDPEIREIPGARSTKVVNFSVAVTRFYTKGNGEKDKETIFMPCEAWDTGAERIALILKKGDPVLIEGSLKEERWEKDGQKHSRMKVRVGSFDKLNRAPVGGVKGSGETEPSEATQSEIDAVSTPPVTSDANTNEEIPF